MKAKRPIWICALLVVLVGAVLALLPGAEDARLHSKERKQWKESAIRNITIQSENSQLLTDEIVPVQRKCP